MNGPPRFTHPREARVERRVEKRVLVRVGERDERVRSALGSDEPIEERGILAVRVEVDRVTAHGDELCTHGITRPREREGGERGA